MSLIGLSNDNNLGCFPAVGKILEVETGVKQK
jgi:hypothetical protein